MSKDLLDYSRDFDAPQRNYVSMCVVSFRSPPQNRDRSTNIERAVDIVLPNFL